jgi:hypothetical protein
MRISLSAAFVLAVVAVSGFGERTNAAPIASLNPGGNQSTISAFASDDDAGTTNSNNVNSLPYTTPTSVTDGASSSTVTPTLSTSALNFSFSQAINDVNSSTNGSGNIYFTAGAGVTFSISGSMTLNGFSEGELKTSLYDVTTSTYAYNYDKTTSVVVPVVQPFPAPEGSSTLTLDISGGSLTGSLNAGNVYEFAVRQSMDDQFDDPNLTGSVGISFNQLQAPGGSSAPLPSAAMSGLTMLLGLGIILARRPKIAAA